MTPDFEYFIRMKVQSEYSHTLSGMLWLDLPLGILLCFLYHNIVRNTLISNLPQFLSKRLSVFKGFGWADYFKNNWLKVIFSLLIGAFSHLFWDSFTHDTGYFVTRLSILQDNLTLGTWRLPIYKVLQHLSTLLGALFIAFTLLALEKHSANTNRNVEKYWFTSATIALTVVVLRLAIGMNFTQYGNLIVTSIAGGLVALILTPLTLKRE